MVRSGQSGFLCNFFQRFVNDASDACCCLVMQAGVLLPGDVSKRVGSLMKVTSVNGHSYASSTDPAGVSRLCSPLIWPMLPAVKESCALTAMGRNPIKGLAERANVDFRLLGLPANEADVVIGIPSGSDFTLHLTSWIPSAGATAVEACLFLVIDDTMQ